MKTPSKPSAKNLAAPLRQAALAGKLGQVRELLAIGADPNRRPSGHPTALIEAARGGHLPIVKELLAAGADPSFCHGGRRGTTALLEAIRSRQLPVARALILAGANVHFDWSGTGQNIAYETAKLCNDLYKSRDKAERWRTDSCLAMMRDLLAAGGRTRPGPFRSAAALGNKGLLQLLLEFGTDVNELDGGCTALEGAVLSGQEEIAVDLLRRGADPWAGKPIPGFGPVLHEAVIHGLTKVVRGIVESKADLNRRGDVVIGESSPETLIEEKDARGNVVGREWEFHSPPTARNATALIVAVRVCRPELVQLLIKGGADLEAADGDGFVPLAWALKLNRPDMAALLRRAGAKEPAHLEGSPQHALVRAAEAGSLEKVQAAIAAGADVNAVYETDRQRYTALMRAAEAGHLQLVEELLKAGGNPDLGGVDRTLTAGITPLMLAARAGHVPVVKRLLESGARPDLQQVNLFSLAFGSKRERGRPLDAAVHEAAGAGRSEIVQLLLQAGAKASDRSGASGSVLEAAAASGDKQTLQTVLAAKTPRRGGRGTSAQALLRAVESGDYETVRTLLASGANANGRTRQGETALATAAGNGDTKIVKLLLQAGAKPSVGPTQAPLSELMLAASGGYEDIVRLLLDAGADVDEQGGCGETALHFAVTAAQPGTVKALLAAGASTAIRNDEGMTPLRAARQVISAWSGKNRHPLIGELPNLKAYRECVDILEQAEKAAAK